MTASYRVFATPPRTFRGHLSACAPAAPCPGGPTLADLQRSISAVLKGIGTPTPLHTTDGHPIHLDLDATDDAHHGMSAGGHEEAAEALRQGKLLLHLRDLKRDAGDARGSLLFDREGRRLLGCMEGHRETAGHKAAMHEHASRAAEHGARAAQLATQIAGKEHIGLAEHEQARTHPAFAQYTHARAAEQRASDGVRRTALAAMGRAGGAAHGLELNRFLERHGHGAHGVDDSSGQPIEHDAGKARLDKTLTGPPSSKPVPLVRPRISDIAARGGEARNAGGRQQRAAPTVDPAQIAGTPVPRPITKATSSAPDAQAFLPVAGAQQRRPLRPDLSVLTHRPRVRAPSQPSEPPSRGRVLQVPRWHPRLRGGPPRDP